MPGGKNNINPSDGKQFSGEYQPTNRKQSTKILSDLLLNKLTSDKNKVKVTGKDVVTGQTRTIYITMPSSDHVITSLIKQAAKGNVAATALIFNRTEGKVLQEMDISTRIDYERMSDENIDRIVELLIKKRYDEQGGEN